MITRKKIRKEDYDYSSNGAYFVTVCAKEHSFLFWKDVGATRCCPKNGCEYIFEFDDFELSDMGKVVNEEIKVLNNVYKNVRVDKYCIMPDHLHFIIFIDNKFDDNAENTPDLSRIMKQFKGRVTKQIGVSVWQKSFYDRIIRNEEEYFNIWNYVDTNPLKWVWNEHNGKKDNIVL